MEPRENRRAEHHRRMSSARYFYELCGSQSTREVQPRPAEVMRTRWVRRADQDAFRRRNSTASDRAVLECVDVEVGVELTIHADEIPVEGGGHPEWVVIGKQQVALRFDRSHHRRRVVRPQRAANSHRTRRRPAIEVADISTRGTAPRPPVVTA